MVRNRRVAGELCGSGTPLGLFRLDPTRALHQADTMVQEFVESLRPVQPVITAFQFRPEQRRDVPRVRREAREMETATTGPCAAAVGVETNFKSVIRQSLHQKA